MKHFFSSFFRQTISKGGKGENFDFTILELKGISAFLDLNSAYSMSELSRNAHMPLSNISMIIDRLSKKGLTRRQRDTKDRRVVRVSLTEKGKQMLAGFMKRRGAELENSFGMLSSKDQSDLYVALEKATAIIEKINY